MQKEKEKWTPPQILEPNFLKIYFAPKKIIIRSTQ